MALLITDACIGCGACESACGQQAISQGESFPIIYVVDPLLCNDCMDCLRVCPVNCLVPDPQWAVCLGRGCPRSSARYDGWGCSQGEDRCAECGSMKWLTPEGEWVCNACRSVSEGRGARCPKTERARRLLEAGEQAPVAGG